MKANRKALLGLLVCLGSAAASAQVAPNNQGDIGLFTMPTADMPRPDQLTLGLYGWKEQLLAGNLALLNGFVVMRDVAHDPRELGAGHITGAAIVARTGDEWYEVEREWRHVRAWSPWRGQLDLETWPRGTRMVDLAASVRSRGPIVLTVMQDGAVLWRSAIMPHPRPMKLEMSCRVRDGHGRLELLASPFGQLEPPVVPDRPPIFAIEDLRFVAPGRDQSRR